jgi:hypothetical protein
MKKEYFMKPLKTKVSITLDTDILEIIKDLAEQDDRSFSQYVNLVLKDYLRNNNLYNSSKK